ncbi:hypothetical protein [Streptomyces sp. GS7]|uniref:hypothetical protein n=1 Tax=Streptomyces sp. GS7 TaxID=2692234 RepID=UPI00131750FD|nr:hypothetical protein [Streptomyces sp. GS7]QHC22865.1 hypothetical protein GR130_16940 [Streptomyces sp. GS7]
MFTPRRPFAGVLSEVVLNAPFGSNYLHEAFEPTARAIVGLEKALTSGEDDQD